MGLPRNRRNRPGLCEVAAQEHAVADLIHPSDGRMVAARVDRSPRHIADPSCLPISACSGQVFILEPCYSSSVTPDHAVIGLRGRPPPR
jgi:hypothetical protein